MMPTMQKGFSGWWNEETEYVFQRIERWAAFARGYNRLRSQRYSRGRMTMIDGPTTMPGWNDSPEERTLEPRFYVENHHRSRRRNSSHPEKMRINCCGTFNYQSNNHLDSQCLETYRYDHSIYFKTIGDIKRDGQAIGRNSARSADLHELEESLSDTSEREQVVWVSKSGAFEHTSRLSVADVDLEIDVYARSFADAARVAEPKEPSAVREVVNDGTWPVIDLRSLDVDSEDVGRIVPVDDYDDCSNGNDDFDYCRNQEKNIDDNNNNNPDDDDDDDEEEYLRRTNNEGLEIIEAIDVASLNDSRGKTSLFAEPKTLNERQTAGKGAKQSRKKILQPRIIGDSYTTNVVAVSSPHRRAIDM